MANTRWMRWSWKASKTLRYELALHQVAHGAHVEVVRTMPFHGRGEEDLLTTGMLHSARQSVQDSFALYGSLDELCRQEALPDPLKAVASEALEAVERLHRLRESWMRHRPAALGEMSGLPGVRLLQRVDCGQLAGVTRLGPWAGDEEAQAAMQIALPLLERLERQLTSFTGVPLFAMPPAGL